MLSQSIWWSSIVLEVFLLTRGVSGRLLFRYPVFYGYISFVLAQSIFRSFVHRWSEELYSSVYWTTEFLGLILGCWIVFEIYRVALAAYPGTAKMARKILLFLFVLALAKAAAALWSDPHLLAETTALQMERALRSVQAIAIVALVAVFASYSIPFGRNLRGILLGYGLFIGERVICLICEKRWAHDGVCERDHRRSAAAVVDGGSVKGMAGVATMGSGARGRRRRHERAVPRRTCKQGLLPRRLGIRPWA